MFAGWQVVLDDAHQWTDYTNVEGDMKLVATQCWENENLPISITINSVVLDGKSYTIDATIKNYNTAATSFKLLATMKTSSGRTVQSTPFTQKQLQAGETRSFTGSMEYLGDANVVSVELVAVALKADDKTGGIYSKAAVCDSITNLQDWHYGAWTDWTTEKLTSSYDDYETKTQYRYNTKQYTTSTTTNNIGNGWIHYNTQSHVGSWSGWLNYSVTAQNTLALKREVETQTVPATYKTQYHYYAWVYSSGSYFTTKSAATKNAGGKTVYLNELWTDNTLTYLKTVSGIKIYKGPAGQYYNNPYWIYADGTAGGINDPTRKVVATAAYTQWKYRDTTYTYQFYKWSDYSAWQDAAVSATSEREVQTRTVYRYRNKEYGTVSGEDTLGTLYTFDGNIDNNAADLSGKTALLMVYKKTNSDPTEAQLEHVEQVTIGDNNSYSLSFKTKEEPTVDTGDFIIALGVEGASALVNIDTIKAPLPTYTVMFYDENNELIGEVQNIAKGGAAIAPDAPEKEGHTFIGWNQSFTNVQADMIINPRYEKKKYSITFIDWEKGTFELKSDLEYGSVIEYPVLEDVEHTISRAWDKQLENVDIVTENMVIQTVSDFETYTVRFLISEEKIIEQQVKYGKAAELPDLSEVEEIEGKLFASWSGSCSPQYITGNVDFVPIYVYEESVKSPVAVVTENADGTCSVTLSCETEGGVIYYVIEDEDCHEATLFGMESEEAEIENIVRLMNEIQGIDDEGDEGFVGIGGYNFLSNAQIYDGEPVQLSENQTLICMASAKGMNDSIPCIEVNSSEFYVDSKNAVNSLRQYRKTIEGDFSIELTNETTSYDFGTFTLCFYDERGVMIDLIPVEAELEPGSNVISFEDVCVDFDGEAASAKLICWMAGENAKPISDAIEIEIK